MLFNSITFLWLFLPILLVLYFSIGKIFPKTKNYILLVFSLVFYAWGEPKYVLLMIASIVVNYIFGLLIDRARRKRKKKQKTLWLVLDIIFNIGLLGHFKYFNFLVANVNNVFGANTLTIGEIALPIGISFYTFQVMSYVIDLYRGEIKVQKNLSKLALYVSFFPQLIAGPIVKYHDIDEALSSRKETTEKFAYGVKRFSYGLAKKVLIADAMAAIVDAIFVTGSGVQGLTQPVAWLGALCYALQIFFDFSGYSDMAIGLGSMFGFKFMENFNLPYISGSITEFWRRWHISLSTWFKEYIYIPLGGNRKGKIRTYINLWIVFLVTGIWHGAAWTFVIWGIFHGFFIFIERLGLKKLLDKMHFLNHFYTLFVVLTSWVIFRAPSLKYALHYLKVMFLGAPADTIPIQIYDVANHRAILTMIIGIVFCGVVQVILKKLSEHKKTKKEYMKMSSFCTKYVEPFVIFALLTLCIMAIVNNTYSAFIYFRF
ncbi:MBOAT family protein [Candidatus Saccharibacteria bacterium]|nr:MBOAT family protein [Candidatus Saccharibacteria bacterium]